MADGDRIARAAPAVALGLFVAGLALAPMAESDLFFRIQAGRDIVARHGLPRINLYSFTYPTHADIDTSWLFEVGAAALYARGGFGAIVLAKTAVLVATFVAAFAVCRRRGAGAAASALALGAAAFVARDRFVERPHVFSLAGVVVVLAAVDALTGQDAPSRPRARRVALATLAAIVLWANLHAGVFVAPLLLALAAVGARLDHDPGAARLAWLTPLAAAATLATPVGLGLVTYLRLHLALPALHAVDEFRAATWTSDAPLFIYGAAVAAALAPRPRRWRELLPVVALGALALRSVRFGADFALVAAPALAVGLERLVPPARARVAALAAAAGLFVAAVAPALAAARAGRPPVEIGLDARALPLDALRFVDDNDLRDHMYNDFEIGSYLLFEGFPRHRVFVDPRLPAYPPVMHALLGRDDLTRAEWNSAMRGYGVDSALLAYAGLNRRVAWWDPASWALVYRAHDARVFVSRAPRHRALIAAREIPATFDFTVESGAATVPLFERPVGSPVADCEWQRRLGELLVELDGAASARARTAYERALAAPSGCLARVDEARLAAWMGAVELGAHDDDRARALLERALALGDDDATTRVNRALALEGGGHATAAAAAWDDVAARAGTADLAAKARARAAALRGTP
ncbi:MAG TPA: hypothetical protein VK989_00265 [Polyangia bacterium]|nr:hypothetical protein [Polyangia bacterium]